MRKLIRLWSRVSPSSCRIAAVTRELGNAVIVLYAQMMRPRAIFSLGTDDTPSPLPHADVAADLSQSGLVDGVNRLRSAFSRGAFRTDVSDFDAPVLQIRIEYTCPMHPEVVQSEPGSCPKCGMNLVPREASATTKVQKGTLPFIGSWGKRVASPFVFLLFFAPWQAVRAAPSADQSSRSVSGGYSRRPWITFTTTITSSRIW